MGQAVRIPGRGGPVEAYLAVPPSPGPGVLVVHGWWALLDHFRRLCDRLAREGFVALAPNLYHGPPTKDPKEAQRRSSAPSQEEAVGDLRASLDHLLKEPSVEPKRVVALGFSMGGGLALRLGTAAGLAGVVEFYGILDVPDWDRLGCPAQGHYAEIDNWSEPWIPEKMFDHLRARGQVAEYFLYPRWSTPSSTMNCGGTTTRRPSSPGGGPWVSCTNTWGAIPRPTWPRASP